jgi:hypothetical protein
MASVIDIEAIKKLPISKRREIIDLIEESIELDYQEAIDNDAPETEEELAILEDRLEDVRKHPEKGISWEDLKKELLSAAK